MKEMFQFGGTDSCGVQEGSEMDHTQCWHTSSVEDPPLIKQELCHMGDAVHKRWVFSTN